MRIVRVNASQPCPGCKNKKVSVTTASPHDCYFNEDDLVTCDKCGREGHIHWCNGTFFYEWKPKPAPTEQEQLTKLLQTIVARSDLDAVTLAVLNCYNKASGPESVFLQPAVEIISTLRQLKYKGYI